MMPNFEDLSMLPRIGLQEEQSMPKYLVRFSDIKNPEISLGRFRIPDSGFSALRPI